MNAPFMVITPLGSNLDPSHCARCQSVIGLYDAYESVFVPYAVLHSVEDDGDMGYCLQCADAIAPLAGYVSRRYDPDEVSDDAYSGPPASAQAIIKALDGYGITDLGFAAIEDFGPSPTSVHIVLDDTHYPAVLLAVDFNRDDHGWEAVLDNGGDQRALEDGPGYHASPDEVADWAFRLAFAPEDYFA